MPSTGQLLGFALASLALIVIPGPGVLFVVGRALRKSVGSAALGGTTPPDPPDRGDPSPEPPLGEPHGTARGGPDQPQGVHLVRRDPAAVR
jgi:hypothetical protein